MILVDNLKLANIPLLSVERESARGKPQPLLIFWHGWTSAKEHNLHYAYLLAEKGYRVLLPDATGHGMRIDELDETERRFGFWEVVIKSITETALLKSEMESNGLIADQKVGLSGTSMGGMIALGALARYDWIKAGVSLMGNPYFMRFAQAQLDYFESEDLKLPFNKDEALTLIKTLDAYDLGAHPDRLNHRPLMFWHGKKDPVVPYVGAWDFYEKVKTGYINEGDRLMFVSDKNAGHKVSRAGVLSMVDWLGKHL